MLARVVPHGARVLELAAGTGEHAVFLAPRLGVAAWQPSDPDPLARASIDAWREDADAVVLPARELDVHARPWTLPDAVSPPDVVLCVNMIHIAPWSACEALLDGASEVLAPGGTLVLYGPYRRGGAHTASSNEAFDASLRARDPSWGVRDLEVVIAEAERRGLVLHATSGVTEMPANNLTVVLVRA